MDREAWRAEMTGGWHHISSDSVVLDSVLGATELQM